MDGRAYGRAWDDSTASMCVCESECGYSFMIYCVGCVVVVVCVLK